MIGARLQLSLDLPPPSSPSFPLRPRTKQFIKRGEMGERKGEIYLLILLKTEERKAKPIETKTLPSLFVFMKRLAVGEK